MAAVGTATVDPERGLERGGRRGTRGARRGQRRAGGADAHRRPDRSRQRLHSIQRTPGRDARADPGRRADPRRLVRRGPGRQRADRDRAGAPRQAHPGPIDALDRPQGQGRSGRRGGRPRPVRDRRGRRRRARARVTDRRRRRGDAGRRAGGRRVPADRRVGTDAQATGRPDAQRIVRGRRHRALLGRPTSAPPPTRRDWPRTPGASRSRARSCARASIGSCAT